jgi:multidrug efflux pump subunit AcrA (membrane-fusion protein)
VLDPQTRRVQQRQVMLGDVGAAGVAVTSGLQPGEQVVTTGVDRLRDGQVVELAGQGPR